MADMDFRICFHDCFPFFRLFFYSAIRFKPNVRSSTDTADTTPLCHSLCQLFP